jgi:hypothetical protein
MLRMDFEVQVVALVGEERRHTSSGTWCVVVGEFGNGGEWFPVALLIVAIDPEVLFQSLVSMFSLTLTLRMVSWGEVQLHFESSPQGLPEMWYKLGTPVRSDVWGDFVLRKDMKHKRVHKDLWGYLVSSKDKDSLFSETVNDH